MNSRNVMKTAFLIFSAAVIGVLGSGCVERRVEYVPAYQPQPAYQGVPPVQGAPAYTYAPQSAYQPAPGQAGNAPAAAVAPQAAPPPDGTANPQVATQAPPPPQVMTQASPQPQVEMVPVAPGPDYAWAPGYWSVGVGGGWVWIGGHYVVRPRPHAVWV